MIADSLSGRLVGVAILPDSSEVPRYHATPSDCQKAWAPATVAPPRSTTSIRNGPTELAPICRWSADRETTGRSRPAGDWGSTASVQAPRFSPTARSFPATSRSRSQRTKPRATPAATATSSVSFFISSMTTPPHSAGQGTPAEISAMGRERKGPPSTTRMRHQRSLVGTCSAKSAAVSPLWGWPGNSWVARRRVVGREVFSVQALGAVSAGRTSGSPSRQTGALLEPLRSRSACQPQTVRSIRSWSQGPSRRGRTRRPKR